MPSPNVDLVVVIDSSRSMRPCFDQLRRHLGSLLEPMQGMVSRLRFGLVAMSCGRHGSAVQYRVSFIGATDMECIERLYHRTPNDGDPHDEFFTDDPQKFSKALSRLVPEGDEDNLLALDMAADFPFGSLRDTKRVIALFADEPFEGGIFGRERNPQIPKLLDKLMARRIQLFVAVPESPAAEEISTADRSEVEYVDGGDGLANVDFSVLLDQMGKSISGASLQSVTEPSFRRALFSQDQWGAMERVAISGD